MQNLLEQWNLSQNWWYIAVAAGILILLWFIARDLPLHKQILSISRSSNRDDQVDNEQEESIVVLSPDLYVIGANKQFYELTGLPEMMTSESSLQDIAKMFPEQTRDASMLHIAHILELGEGSIELTIQSKHAVNQHIMMEVYSITDGTKVICKLLSIKLYHK